MQQTVAHHGLCQSPELLAVHSTHPLCTLHSSVLCAYIRKGLVLDLDGWMHDIKIYHSGVAGKDMRIKLVDPSGTLPRIVRK